MTIQGKPARQLYEGAVDTWTQLALRCFVFYLFWLLIDPKKKKKKKKNKGGALGFFIKPQPTGNSKKKERKKGNGEEKEERGLGSQSNRQMLLIRGDTVRRG